MKASYGAACADTCCINGYLMRGQIPPARSGFVPINRLRASLSQLSVLLVCLILLLIPVAPAYSAGNFGSPIDFTMYRLATEYNDPSAQYLVGRNYLHGKTVAKDVREALKWFQMAAKQNHVRAQYQLGRMYLHGEEVKSNLEYAHFFLSKAAENQHVDAQFELGNYFIKLGPDENNYRQAVHWYKTAANRGHIRSNFALGKMTYEGKGTARDEVLGRRLIKNAAENGDIHAVDYINSILFNTQAVQSPARREPAFADNDTFPREAPVADRDIEQSTISMPARLPEKREPRSRIDPELNSDDNSARSRFRIAADASPSGNDFRKAPANTGSRFDRHPPAGSAPSLRQDDFRQERGDPDRDFTSNNRDSSDWRNDPLAELREDQSQSSLSRQSNEQRPGESQNSYLNKDNPFREAPSGRDREERNRQAEQLALQQPTENEDRFSQQNDSANLSSMSNADRIRFQMRQQQQNPTDVPKRQPQSNISKAQEALSPEEQYQTALAIMSMGSNDPLTVAQLLTKASLRNHPAAQFELANLYKRGLGVSKNRGKYVEWLVKAGESGHEKALTELDKILMQNAEAFSPEQMFSFGIRYANGDGIKQNSEKAAIWLLRAAENNHTEAQFRLGEMYQNGIGVEPNDKEAMLWLEKASSGGSQKARLALASLNNPAEQNKKFFLKDRNFSDESVSVTDSGTAVITMNAEDNSRNSATRSKLDFTVQDTKNTLSQRPPTRPPETNRSQEKLSDRLRGSSKEDTTLVLNQNKNTKKPEARLEATPSASFEQGLGMLEKNDKETGLQLLENAANGGHVESQIKLGKTYYQGKLVAQNYVTAAKWFEKAANNGSMEAQFLLAELYKKGLGVEKNNSKAIKWYRKAANQGHKEARKRLGGCRIC